MKSSRRFFIRKQAWLLLPAALFLSALAGLLIGAVSVPLPALFSALIHPSAGGIAGQILWQIRMPRVLADVLCGSALAVSGLMIQTLLNNPLASPNLLGVNSGAGLATALCGVVLPVGTRLTPAFAFAGAVMSSLLILAVTIRNGAKRTTVLLAGVAIGSILSAGIDAVHTFYPDSIPGYRSFVMGGFSGVGRADLYPAALYILAGLAVALLLSGELNVFVLGDETAATLGMRVNLYRGVILVISSVLAGAAVSVCGLLGFVGLMTPHLARKLLLTGNHRVLTPACAVLGAALVSLCDLVSRTLFMPYEIPAGIILSFIGGPFFLYLLLGRKRHA